MKHKKIMPGIYFIAGFLILLIFGFIFPAASNFDRLVLGSGNYETDPNSTADITFQNDEYLTNYTDGTIATNAAMDFGGSLTLENDETIANSTDADLLFTFNDDATTLGQFIIRSSNASTGDNDVFDLIFRALDDSAGYDDIVLMQGKFLDVTDETEDSELLFKTLQAGSAVSSLKLTGGTLTLENSETIDNETNGTVNITAGVFKHGFDAAAYWTATQADAGLVTLNSVSDGTSGFVFTDDVEGDDFTVNTVNWGGTTASAAGTDTYTCTVTPAPDAYVTGMPLYVIADTANTGACTINMNSLGAKNVKTASGTDPANNDLITTAVSMLIYDGTNFVLINPATTCD